MVETMSLLLLDRYLDLRVVVRALTELISELLGKVDQCDLIR